MELTMESSISVLCIAVALIIPSSSATSCQYLLFIPSSQHDGYIMSLNYPGLYSSGLCFKWVYYGQPGMQINIRILDIDIPSSSDTCSNDFLMIGAINERIYCGSIAHKSFDLYEAQLTSSQNWVYVIFNSTNVGTKGRGFKLYYQLIRPTQTTVTEIPRSKIPSSGHSIHNFTDRCVYQLSDQSGEITSSGLIDDLHMTGYCSWLLYTQATDGYSVVYTLTFEKLQLSENSIFRIYDGANVSSPDLGTYPALVPPFSVTSSQNSVFIYYSPKDFHSTSLTDAFTIKYTAFVRCALGYQPCGYGEFSCFREENRCDGLWHCPLHGGDERGCVAECGSNFSCDLKHSNCYTESDRCNGKGTCSNYMDELGCSEDRCSSNTGLYLCRNGRCISEKDRCDRMNDCFDNSDEEDCSVFRPTQTTVTEIPRSRIPLSGHSTRKFSDTRKFTDRCVYQLSDQSGEITSFGLFDDLHMTGYCSWLLYIQPTDGYSVVYTLTFEKLHLSENSIFRIYDGANVSSPDLGTYPDLVPPFSVTSSQNSVFIYYSPKEFLSTSLTDVFTIKYTAFVRCVLGYEPCGYGEFRCFREENRCDGLWHCPLHGGDERGCVAECGSNFSCDLKHSNCYTESDRCNGKGTCSNYMDELGCSEDRCSSDNGLYLCRNGRCIYEKWKCDRMNDCFDNSDEEDCSVFSSPRVIVAAVIGSLLCALLLVIAVGCVCKVYHMRVNQLRGGPHHETPLSRQLAEMFYHRAPPPPYHEAMLTSRPYDEAYLELLGQTEQNLEASGASNDQNANPPPPRERPQRSNQQASRRCRHNRRRQDQLRSSRFRPETDRLAEAERLPIVLEVFGEGALRQGSSSAVPANSAEPPPYSEHDPSLTAGSYCSDSEDESSDNEDWQGGVENAGYAGDDDSHASVDGESVIELEVIPTAANRRPLDLTSVSSSLCLRNSTDIRTGPERHFDDGSNKDDETASTSVVVDSSQTAVEVDNKTQQRHGIIDEDSDSDCILDGNNDDDVVGTDSDAPCILGHT